MECDLAMIVEREQGATSDLECLIDKRLLLSALQHPHDNLDVVLAKAVESERLAGRVNLTIRPDFFMSMLRRPLHHVSMKAFAIANDRRQEQQVTASLNLPLQVAAQFVACLCFYGEVAIRAIL